MKFNVSSQALYGITSSVSKIISAKNPIQILNNFLFTLDVTNLLLKLPTWKTLLLAA